jgi:phage tail-like protein
MVLLQMPSASNPYLTFKFQVEIHGLIVGGFSEISGLQAEVDVETIEEGGVNDYVHKLPKKTKYPNLIL